MNEAFRDARRRNDHHVKTMKLQGDKVLTTKPN